MPKRKLRNLLNLGAFSNHKKLPTYKKKKQQGKHIVSNHDNNSNGSMQTDSAYRNVWKPPNQTQYLCLQFLREKGRGHISPLAPHSAGTHFRGQTHQILIPQSFGPFLTLLLVTSQTQSKETISKAWK